MTSRAWSRGRALESYRVMLDGLASSGDPSPRQQEARAHLSVWCEARGICLLPQQPTIVRVGRRSSLELGRLMRACFAVGVQGYLIRIDIESVPLIEPRLQAQHKDGKAAAMKKSQLPGEIAQIQSAARAAILAYLPAKMTYWQRLRHVAAYDAVVRLYAQARDEVTVPMVAGLLSEPANEVRARIRRLVQLGVLAQAARTRGGAMIWGLRFEPVMNTRFPMPRRDTAPADVGIMAYRRPPAVEPHI